MRGSIRPGTYRTESGDLVRVERTENDGYLVRHADGTVTVIGGES